MKVQITKADMQQMQQRILAESKADIMNKLASNEELMDKYASQLGRGETWVNSRSGQMVKQDPNEGAMEQLVYDCQQKYGFCERPAAMKSLVRDYLMPVIQKIAREKYGYNGPVWPSKDEQKGLSDIEANGNEQKLQSAGAEEKLQSERLLYWTGFAFCRDYTGMRNVSKQKQEQIRDVLREIGVYMTPQEFVKTPTGKKFLKDAKAFYNSHDCDYATHTFKPKGDKMNESRKIQITEADMSYMRKAILSILNEDNRTIFGQGAWGSNEFVWDPEDEANPEFDKEKAIQKAIKSLEDIAWHWDYYYKEIEKWIQKNNVGEKGIRTLMERKYGNSRLLFRFNAMCFCRNESCVDKLIPRLGWGYTPDELSVSEVNELVQKILNSPEFLTPKLEQLYQEFIQEDQEKVSKRNQERRAEHEKFKTDYPDLYALKDNLATMSFVDVYKMRQRVNDRRDRNHQTHYFIEINNLLDREIDRRRREVENVGLDYINGWEKGGEEYQLLDKIREMSKDPNYQVLYYGRSTGRCLSHTTIYICDKEGNLLRVVGYSVDSSD